jgi:tetratricopeptide (TPR) repeat protein
LWTNYKRLNRWLVPGLLLGCAGCAAAPLPPSRPPVPAPPPSPSPAPAPEAPVASLYPTESIRTPLPRARASLRLTERARQLIAARKADEAIRTLEKALNIDPQNGRCYYYLAEAWLMKSDSARAVQFNRLAAIHLKNDRSWGPKVNIQKQRIQNNLARTP